LDSSFLKQVKVKVKVKVKNFSGVLNLNLLLPLGGQRILRSIFVFFGLFDQRSHELFLVGPMVVELGIQSLQLTLQLPKGRVYGRVHIIGLALPS